jgi:hypothetical protein
LKAAAFHHRRRPIAKGGGGARLGGGRAPVPSSLFEWPALAVSVAAAVTVTVTVAARYEQAPVQEPRQGQPERMVHDRVQPWAVIDGVFVHPKIVEPPILGPPVVRARARAHFRADRVLLLLLSRPAAAAAAAAAAGRALAGPVPRRSAAPAPAPSLRAFRHDRRHLPAWQAGPGRWGPRGLTPRRCRAEPAKCPTVVCLDRRRRRRRHSNSNSNSNEGVVSAGRPALLSVAELPSPRTSSPQSTTNMHARPSVNGRLSDSIGSHPGGQSRQKIRLAGRFSILDPVKSFHFTT